MALLQISEPGQTTAPHQHRLAVGIDLGTTNSLVATVRSSDAQTLPDENWQHILPSVVRYAEEAVEVGEAAIEHAVSDPSNTIVSVKRLMGRAASDLKSLGESSPYQFLSSESAVPNIKTLSGRAEGRR